MGRLKNLSGFDQEEGQTRQGTGSWALKALWPAWAVKASPSGRHHRIASVAQITEKLKRKKKKCPNTPLITACCIGGWVAVDRSTAPTTGMRVSELVGSRQVVGDGVMFCWETLGDGSFDTYHQPTHLWIIIVADQVHRFMAMHWCQLPLSAGPATLRKLSRNGCPRYWVIMWELQLSQWQNERQSWKKGIKGIYLFWFKHWLTAFDCPFLPYAG